MTAKWIETVTGSLEQKKQYKQAKSRMDALPEPYRTVAAAYNRYLMYYGVASFNDGFIPGVKAFTAAVLGGIGSLPGAVLGGLLIGLIESLWSAYFSIAYKDVATFAILAFVLIFKPTGILGRPEVEKV